MSAPQFSVVIPCFNVAATVEETVASVSAQTLRDLEIIAVDNNSTDTTPDVLARLAAREPRMRIVREQVQGLSAARNGGIRAARARHVAFLDADDLFDPDYLEAHADNLADGCVGVSYARIRLVDPAGRPTGQVTSPPLDGLTAVDLLRSNPCTSMVVVRRDVLERVGPFNETMRRMEDQEWLFRAAAAGFRLRGIGRPLASYRIMPGGLSSNLEAMLAAHGQMLDSAARVAPHLSARDRRLSHAAMLRYCARRAMDHRAGSAEARAYLGRMLVTAPDILIREPMPTLRTIASVLLPGTVERLARRPSPPRPQGA
jgi:glycosyltransferase involved in cell wall biosynthesis